MYIKEGKGGEMNWEIGIDIYTAAAVAAAAAAVAAAAATVAAAAAKLLLSRFSHVRLCATP